jgi:protein SCO1/2
LSGKGKNTWIYTLGITAAIFIIGVVIAYFMITDAQENADRNRQSLKVINPDEVNAELVDESMRDIQSGHIIAPFSLTDQYGEVVTQEVVKGKVYVADFFFTTCPGICIAMTRNLTEVQKKMADQKDFLILSHTVWPEVDSVPVMNAYALKHGAVKGKWYFLTGEKQAIYQLARKSYFTLKPAAVGEPGDGGSDFIHTANFVLIDRQGQIRGYYNGTKMEEVEQMMEDARKLLRDPA